ncbi:Uncharacterized protein BN871_AI_00040 [Paenibacillus sp. P22]|nr:Uncharacterized protein BN871_AI_00040 [Paenibacillus sp. P22]
MTVRTRFRIEYLAAAGAAGIIIWLLFTRPFIGMADSGDFLRVLMTAGLDYNPAATTYEDRFFSYANQHFAYGSLRGAYITSQLIPVFIARGLGWLYDPSLFNIRILAAVYGALLVAAVYLLVHTGRRYSMAVGVVLTAGLLFVFLDVRYLAYFNSFFAEPVSLIFLLLTLGTGLRLAHQEEPGRWTLIFFFFCVFMLACGKLQNTPLGVVFALYGLRFLPLRWDRAWRKLVLICCSALFLLSALLYVFAPDGLKHINLYQTVFYGILNKSPDVKGDLKALGLPEKLAGNAGSNYFQTDVPIKQDAPEMRVDFYDRMSHGKVMLYYATHPQRLIGLMERAAHQSVYLKPGYLGNYEKAEGKPPGAFNDTYSGWSRFKAGHMPNSLLFIVLFYIVYYGVCVIEWLRAREGSAKMTSELLMLVGFVGFFAFLIPIMGDGLADIEKHLFLFNAAYDIMLLASAAWLAYRIAVLLGFGRDGRRISYRSYR